VHIGHWALFDRRGRTREGEVDMDAPARVAIVTGATRGIGAAVSQRLASDGFAIVVDYSGDAAGADEVVRRVKGGGGTALAVEANVADSTAVRGLFDQAESAYGGVDVLVNNAGIMGTALMAETDDESFDRHIAVNLKGTFNGMREAAKRLRRGGRIINFSSSVIGLYQPRYSVYAATKGGVEAMSKVLANELRGRDITVNVVAPGPTGTDLFLKGKPQKLIDELANLAPLGRLGTPEDIARVVSFLAGPDGAWVNGQVLRANGGAV
jgi:3-oxoacyl-[acyl-carrier protein] reductase